MTKDQPNLSRREFAAMSALAAAGLATINTAAGAQTTPTAEAPPSAYMNSLPLLRIGLLVFPQLTAMDMVAPQLCMHMMMKTEMHIVAQTAAPVMCDSGFAILPTSTFADCPKDLDVLFVPGGPKGTEQALRNDALLDFVADRGARARYVTSVCTGSMILGAAGLLKGYRAASHWMTRDMLPMFGATPVDERVVIDRNRMTGGGITAGLDFGLVLAAQLRDESVARLAELALEYDPQPPFKSGSMKTAQADTIKTALRITGAQRRDIQSAGEQARARRSI
jgi:putative intracellular protease/amidase